MFVHAILKNAKQILPELEKFQIKYFWKALDAQNPNVSINITNLHRGNQIKFGKEVKW